MASVAWGGLEVFTTCPPSSDTPTGDYLGQVRDIAVWSDEAGCDGILVYTDNRLLDPWVVSDAIIRSTAELMPLVAVQPIYLHPYAAAKIVATFAHLYGRRICLNMVAGGFRNDLVALDDHLAHDDRYDRLVEFTQIVEALAEGSAPVSYRGSYYAVTNLSLTPAVPPELRPRIFISGSSRAGLAAAGRVGATAVKYPQRSDDEVAVTDEGLRCGIRVGIIARSTEGDAWEEAHRRFPVDRKGQIAHMLAMKVSDSGWHKTLSDLASPSTATMHPYWLGPFENYKTFCPYLVGSYETVGEELARYIALGFESFILDVPASPEELVHTQVAMRRAVEFDGAGREEHA